MELIGAFVDAGASLKPVLYARPPPTHAYYAKVRSRGRSAGAATTTSSMAAAVTATADAGNEGVSLLHVVAFPHQTANIAQALVQEVFAKMKNGVSE